MRNSIKPSPQGIIFDMDGVLLIETQHPEQSWQEVCQQFAPTLHIPSDALIQALRQSRHEYKLAIEYNAEMQRRDRLEPFETRQEMVERALQVFGRGTRIQAEAMVHAYEAIRNKSRQLAPHALEVLQELRKRELPLALISNGNATYQRRKITQHCLASFFEIILIEEEFGVAKPDQRIFLHALDQLHRSAHETWMIGDNLAFDIAGSQQVGIFAVWCNFAHKVLPNENTVQPDWIIHDLLDILGALQ